MSKRKLKFQRCILPKTPTSIKGLDKITGGGLPKGRSTLICGGAGCVTKIKRLVDISLALLLLIVTAPFLLFSSIVILLETGKNPFYLQLRGLILEKKLFTLYKLRTLKETNEPVKITTSVLEKHELEHCVTRYGKFLRKTGLDELPQLFNILKGEMSFVGPRPLSVSDLQIIKNKYPEIYKLRKSLCLNGSKIADRPGLTGYWQVLGDRSKGIENLIELEVFYRQNASVGLDTKIFLKTIPIVLFAMHSDAILYDKPLFNEKEKKEVYPAISRLNLDNEVNC